MEHYVMRGLDSVEPRIPLGNCSCIALLHAILGVIRFIRATFSQSNYQTKVAKLLIFYQCCIDGEGLRAIMFFGVFSLTIVAL